MQTLLQIGFLALVVFVVVYIVIRNIRKPSTNVSALYNEILTSEKYKVKGQFEE
jgi:hypothetical protein